MPAGSKMDPPLAKAKPISASVITYLRRRKTLRERAFAAGERRWKLDNSEVNQLTNPNTFLLKCNYSERIKETLRLASTTGDHPV
ncbi:zinc finger protein 462-like [Grus japonensis]|uniref:Zinc finger protein 462-like n=1 Tax=Grus japonensis TaxID=30415 RepID=A0ABC9W7J2_GRUJA